MPSSPWSKGSRVAPTSLTAYSMSDGSTNTRAQTTDWQREPSTSPRLPTCADRCDGMKGDRRVTHLLCAGERTIADPIAPVSSTTNGAVAPLLGVGDRERLHAVLVAYAREHERVVVLWA